VDNQSADLDIPESERHTQVCYWVLKDCAARLDLYCTAQRIKRPVVEPGVVK
jgi:hypothetical protein